MQAHLNDLAMTDKDSKSFTICQRVLLRCHEIIFEDTPGIVSGPYSTIKVKCRKLQRRKRVKHHVEPALVGIGCMFAGVPGMPRLTEVVGHSALEQGRAEDNEQHYRSLEEQDDDGDVVAGPSRLQRRAVVDPETVDEDQDDDDELGNDGESEGRESRQQSLERSRKLSLAATAISRSHSQKLAEAARTTPSFSRMSSDVRHSEASDDPFGQLDGSSMINLPSRSTPAILVSKSPRKSGSGNVVDDVLRSYDLESQSLCYSPITAAQKYAIFS